MAMENVESIFKIILYVFSIILILIVIFVFVLPYWQKSNDIKKYADEIDIINDTIDDDSIGDLIMKPSKKYVYDKKIQNLSLSNSAGTRESTLNYKEFTSVVFTTEFIQRYHLSLKTSLIEKKKIYTRKQKQLNADLKNNQNRVGGGFSSINSHDSNLERLTRAYNEMNQIIKAIDYRLDNLSYQQIQTDFDEAIYNPEFGIESLVGRDDVKDILALQIFTFARNPKLFFTSFQNITIYGRSGVGKSKLAETIGFVYSKSGILVRRKVRNVTKQEFTSSYVNESSQLTRELLLSTLEGVLFIDEAYDLMPPKTMLGSTIDHGHEAVTELVNFLDKNIGLSVVIAAGYEDEMEERFIGANQGLDRRFPHKIKLNNYSSRQLTDILLKFLEKSGPQLDVSNSDAGYMYTLIDFLCKNKTGIFDKQAGDMLILSSYLVRSVYGSVIRHWTPGDDLNNAEMILDGFNDYLRNRNISIISGERKKSNGKNFKEVGNKIPEYDHNLSRRLDQLAH